MAITNIRGTVNRVFYNGKGAEVVEKFNVKGQERSKYWTAWFDEPHGLQEGQEVEVSGMHSDEINEYEKDGETRRNIKRAINKARVKGDAQPAQQSPAPEPWDAGVSNAFGSPESSEVPF